MEKKLQHEYSSHPWILARIQQKVDLSQVLTVEESSYLLKFVDGMFDNYQKIIEENNDLSLRIDELTDIIDGYKENF